jgi:DNA-binding response OmpR family regulator
MRVLLVEDELLIAAVVEEFLIEAGHQTIGPFSRLDDAMNAAAHEAIDAALLDVNLRGDLTFGLAERLLARNVPVVFCTGYADAPIFPRSLDHVPRLAKPCAPESLTAALAASAEAASAQAASAQGAGNRNEHSNPSDRKLKSASPSNS